jgi:catechol 2,3-dioxygenase-like lactoylglutathione lyase family enzyme
MDPAVEEMRVGAGASQRQGRRPTGLQRAGYVAHRSPDPEAAAAFATERMGFSLVHVDGEGRHYLAAAGLDPYSLIFAPGEERGIDHVSFVVHDLDALDREEERLRATGAAVERVDPNPLWRAGRAVRVMSPAGHAVHVTPGVPVAAPMGSLIVPSAPEPAPISFDHVAILTPDVEAEVAFATGVLGLRESCRVNRPDGATAVAFCRAHTLFHCYTIVEGSFNGLHHYQFTLKNRAAVLAACEEISKRLEIFWGPLRHGPGHNVAFYFRDRDGNFVEFSAEEELILDEGGYVNQNWSTDDPAFADEWNGTRAPAEFHP